MEYLHHSRQDVRASIWFLEENALYATVKPYTLAFTPEPEIPRENIQRREVSLTISDLRGNERMFTVDRNGFMVLNFPDQHKKVDWDNKSEVIDVHYPNIVAQIQDAFPEAQCVALRHQVSPVTLVHCKGFNYLLSFLLYQIRKRHSTFPKSTGTDYTYGQPLRAAHVGKA